MSSIVGIAGIAPHVARLGSSRGGFARGAASPRLVARSTAGRSLRRRAPATRSGENVWDPDEQRRIDENKRWKRTDAPEDAWDIDKERDAVMYKRESLERLLALTPKEEKPDKPWVCAKCGAPVTRRSAESQKDKAHIHRLNYGESFVSVSVYDAADVRTPEGAVPDAKAANFWPPRVAVKCACHGCGEVLGWSVSDNAQETVGPFFALLTSRLKRGEEGTAEA